MPDTTDTDDGSTDDATTGLQANRFGLDAAEIDALLDTADADLDALLDEVATDADLDLDPVGLDADDIDDLLDAGGLDPGDIDDLLDEVATDDLDALLETEQADLYAEQVARQWGTPEGAWWP